MTAEHDPTPVRARSPANAKEMPFLDHLEELRRVLIDSLIAVGVGLCLAWAVSGRVLDLLISRTMPAGMPVIFLGPAEAFGARVKVALTCAVLITLPFIFWRVWQFVVPGLLREERAYVLPAVFCSTVLFYIGSAFGFLVLVPAILHILLAFGTPRMTPTIAVGNLLGFVLQLSLACGVVFQLPLVTTVLTIAGVVTPEWLWRRWRYAVLIFFVVAAGITPGDGPSMLLLAVPLSLLYLASVAISFAVRRRRARQSGVAVDASSAPAGTAPHGPGIAPPTPPGEG